MTYGPALYLVYGQIAIGIELLGACRDTHDFDQQGHSKCRFERGISDYMAQVDSRYATYNNSASPYYLYKHLRLRHGPPASSSGRVAFIGRGNAQNAGIQHFDIPQNVNALFLIGETFYDHFAQACSLLLADLSKLPHPKLQGDFLPVS